MRSYSSGGEGFGGSPGRLEYPLSCTRRLTFRERWQYRQCLVQGGFGVEQAFRASSRFLLALNCSAKESAARPCSAGRVGAWSVCLGVWVSAARILGPSSHGILAEDGAGRLAGTGQTIFPEGGAESPSSCVACRRPGGMHAFLQRLGVLIFDVLKDCWYLSNSRWPSRKASHCSAAAKPAKWPTCDPATPCGCERLAELFLLHVAGIDGLRKLDELQALRQMSGPAVPLSN
jgi:hypothetical protein